MLQTTKNLLFKNKKGKKKVFIKGYYSPKNRYGINPRANDKLIKILDKNENIYAKHLSAMVSYRPYIEKIALYEDEYDADPFWVNGWIPSMDAMSIYAFLASKNPSIYLEIGSGNSTKFARRAILDHGLRTKIISIDPVPRAFVDNLCDSVIRKPLEEVDHEVFNQLNENDVLFCDSSHRTFQNSDVTVFFTEIIPLLQKGVIYGLHDICLPFDYPDLFLRKFWNEQYMLHTYLLGGADGDKIILPISYISSYTKNNEIAALHAEFFSKGKLLEVAALRETTSGGCFWLKRNAAPALKC